MRWNECLKRNLVERKRRDKKLSFSLMKMAEKRIEFFASKEISVFVLEGVYEAILELCHAFLALEGLKTLSHECAIEFLREKNILKTSEVEFLHRLRRKRHKTKYYGLVIDEQALRGYIESSLKIFTKLKNALKNTLDYL